MLEKIMRWLAPALGVAAAAVLPAVSASVPFLVRQQWTIAQMLRGTGSGSYAALLQSARQLGAAAQAGAGLDRALRLGQTIPTMAAAAGVCALLALVMQAWRPTRGLAAMSAAGTGLVCALYAIGACWFLTRAARTGMALALGQAEGKLHLAQLDATAATLREQTALRPEAALYVLVLLFAVMLLLPEAKPAPPSMK